MNNFKLISDSKNRILLLKFLVLFAFNILILLPLLVYGGNYNFSIDSYGILYGGSQVHTYAFIRNSRFFGAFLYWLMDLIIGHNPILNSTPDIIVCIILMSCAVTALSIHISQERFIDCITVNFAALLSVANVWFCNILSFPECVLITAVGVCLCFLSIIVFTYAKNAISYIVSAVLLISATGVYQQFLCVFTVFIVAIYGAEILKSRCNSLKELFSFYVKPVVFIVVCAIIYFVIAMFISNKTGVEANSRIALSFSSIVNNIIYFITHQHSYLKGRGFFESELLTLCFLAIGFVWAVLLVIDWFKYKQTIKTVFLGLSYCAAYATTFLPGIVTTSTAARAMFAMFSVFALFAIGALSFNRKKALRIIICGILVVALFMNIAKSFEVEKMQKEQNASDALWADKVVQLIDSYEYQTGYTVETISYCTDSVNNMSIYSESVGWVDYAFKSIINLHSDKPYQYEKMQDEIKAMYFNNREWDCFIPEEQLVFNETTLYICCY